MNVSPGNGKPDKVNFPGQKNLNNSPYKILENKLKAEADAGKTVKANFKKIFNEGNTSERADKFVVEYTVGNGKLIIREFLNQPGG
ncbi:MAG: hypothetical protein HRU38_25935 [Saccharospirillaceae bacterium]|nr:hypothetical protein [Saccharospirillaceae bacterium]